MILVDTAVWIDHLGYANPNLLALLEQKRLLIHPFVLGEIALGSLKDRSKVIGYFAELPAPIVAEHDEVLSLIVERDLGGTGIGYVDAHLLASTILTGGTTLWTHDKRLAQCAERLGVLNAQFKTRLN